jgi:two-component system response regulator
MERPILLVEDTDDDAELTIRAFENAGVKAEIVRAYDGAEALEYLLGGNVKEIPQAVLLDLGLPKVGGLDVLRAIQREDRTRQVPVIVMTTSRDDEHRLMAYDQGALSFVRKPVNYEEFVRAVRTMDLHWSASLSVFGTGDH